MDEDNRILLILDLDETLVHAAERPLAQTQDFLVGPYFVYRRPHLGEFLTACAARFRLAVWSTAGDEYIAQVVRRILPPNVELVFAWGRSRCARKYNTDWFEDEFLKDLKKVKRAGYPLERVLIVEDTPRKVHRHYGNAVYVPPYLGATDDDVLPRLTHYLDSIHQTPNVRVLEKRGWIQRFL
jgi:RNA polymerase II subunit A small phosphatase-like protein